MTSTTTASPFISDFNLQSLYHALWEQQDYSVVKRFKCNVPDLEEQEQVHSFNFDAIDLSRCPGAKLPNGATSIIIRSEYEAFCDKVSMNERNIVIHGSAGIGKTYFLLYALVRRLLQRQPVTYQLDQPDSRVLCFTADGFFVLPEENSHPLSQCEDVLHLIDSTQEDAITHLNTDHTRALMRGTCGRAIFTTFWPDNLDLDIERLPEPEDDIVLRKWMKPCTFDEIFAMSALTPCQHEAEAKPLQWSYIHFGSNARACLQASQHASDADYYLKELERAHDNLWRMQPAVRKSEALCSRHLFAVEPGKNYSDPRSFPVSQVATRLFAGEITSIDSAGAKETAYNLLKSADTKVAGEIFYRQAVVALMSRLGGIFTLGERPDLHCHCHRAQEELVLLTKTHVEHEKHQAMPSSSIYSSQRELSLLAENCPQILHTPQHALVHPGIDAIMFDADKLTVWLVQVTHGCSRPVSPEGFLFLLGVVRGSPYEPSPTHPWQFVYVTQGQPTKPFFYLSGKEKTRSFHMRFWKARIKPYVMQLSDMDRDRSSSNPYDQWGFPYKAPQKSSSSLLRRLANSLPHRIPRSRRVTELDTTNDNIMSTMSEIECTFFALSGVPGAQLLGEMVKEQVSGPDDHYMRDYEQTSSWRKTWAKVCR